MNEPLNESLALCREIVSMGELCNRHGSWAVAMMLECTIGECCRGECICSPQHNYQASYENGTRYYHTNCCSIIEGARLRIEKEAQNSP